MSKAAAVALLWAALVSVSASARADDQACFRILDATGYRSKPDLRRYGIEPAAVIYAHQHFWPNNSPLQDLPRRAVVDFTVQRRVAAESSPLLIIDLEHWPNVGSDEVVAESVRKYVTLIEWVKDSAAGSAAGYYGVPPLRDYWRAIQEPASTPYKEWQAQNDRFKELAAAVAVLTPSLYTFYDDAEGWKRYAAANMKEARRLAEGKPVYAFIWPQYHDSNSKLKGQYLPATFWLQELQTLETLADGVIIWAAPGWWDDEAPWWLATRAFMESSSKICRQPSS